MKPNLVFDVMTAVTLETLDPPRIFKLTVSTP